MTTNDTNEGEKKQLTAEERVDATAVLASECPGHWPVVTRASAIREAEAHAAAAVEAATAKLREELAEVSECLGIEGASRAIAEDERDAALAQLAERTRELGIVRSELQLANRSLIVGEFGDALNRADAAEAEVARLRALVMVARDGVEDIHRSMFLDKTGRANRALHELFAQLDSALAPEPGPAQEAE